jgi:tellurite methyltransferase
MEKINKTKKGGWDDFFEKTKNNPPRVHLVNAIKYIKEKEIALDLGAGALRDTQYLLDQGFKKVIAIDKEEIIKNIQKEIGNDRLETMVSSFKDFEYGNGKYNLINAQYSLPFMEKDYFTEVISKIKNSLKIEGIFVGTFFGDKDSWNNENSKIQNFHKKKDIEKMFDDFQILELLEKEEDRPAVNEEMKHWHTLHLTARKIGDI